MRMKTIRIPVAILLPFLLLAACGGEGTAPVGSPALLESGADQVAMGLEHVITINGIREGMVRADTAFFFNDSTVTLLRNPTLELFNESGYSRARVTAERGRYNMNTKELAAFGNVVLVIPEGDRRVESPELHYEPSGDRIWSDSMTVMHDAGIVSRGMGFYSDLDFSEMRVGAGSIRRSERGGAGL